MVAVQLRSLSPGVTATTKTWRARRSANGRRRPTLEAVDRNLPRRSCEVFDTTALVPLYDGGPRTRNSPRKYIEQRQRALLDLHHSSLILSRRVIVCCCVLTATRSCSKAVDSLACAPRYACASAPCQTARLPLPRSLHRLGGAREVILDPPLPDWSQTDTVSSRSSGNRSQLRSLSSSNGSSSRAGTGEFLNEKGGENFELTTLVIAHSYPPQFYQPQQAQA